MLRFCGSLAVTLSCNLDTVCVLFFQLCSFTHQRCRIYPTVVVAAALRTFHLLLQRCTLVLLTQGHGHVPDSARERMTEIDVQRAVAEMHGPGLMPCMCIALLVLLPPRPVSSSFPLSNSFHATLFHCVSVPLLATQACNVNVLTAYIRVSSCLFVFYYQDVLLSGLLNRDLNAAFNHIRGLKDIVECK